jgi:hypothetical protein
MAEKAALTAVAASSITTIPPSAESLTHGGFLHGKIRLQSS